jgi:hypothetical protein
MRELVADSLYGHPVHFMILDPYDPIWKMYFTILELEEISTFGTKNHR